MNNIVIWVGYSYIGEIHLLTFTDVLLKDLHLVFARIGLQRGAANPVLSNEECQPGFEFC